MKILLASAILLSFLTAEYSVAQEPCPLFGRYYNKKKKPFYLKFPNIATKLNVVPTGKGEVVGTIEWCRKSYTRTGVDDCGRTIQWRATDITYREVLCNGAYGKCFTKTQLDSPIQYVVATSTPTYYGSDKQPAYYGSGKQPTYYGNQQISVAAPAK